MKMAIKVSIYESDASRLERLSYLIRGSDNFELCTASSSVVNIMDDCKRLCPDVILMDGELSDMSGIKATMLVKNAYPAVDVMMFTVAEDRDKVIDALYAGATGYLLKKSSSVQIIEAVEELARGGSPVSGGIARIVLEYFTKQESSKKQDQYRLTKREQEVLQRLLMGDSYKMVADACNISIGTVYSHINNIYKKLNINSKSEAVIKAIRERLV